LGNRLFGINRLHLAPHGRSQRLRIAENTEHEHVSGRRILRRTKVHVHEVELLDVVLAGRFVSGPRNNADDR
jgi:hypothetical protein